HYENEPETCEALDLIFDDRFSRFEPGVFEPIRRSLLTEGDYYMHLADLGAYADAQSCLAALRATPESWSRKAILNVAGSRRFSSDRTVTEYATDIWKAKPCPVP